ncbi:hypothetical protein [Rhodococcus sp. 1168]|uniref:hypothetical protein n=1 Tax=Rhodococcus sp. 1168 TaxID=2018041 RepID=UPI000A0CDBDE|nr:hypothetical protein [Rhodococcus sp. 1168]ORI13471.1 hypothetical protein BJI47_22775 [Rhodococcus sp. 1168]
MIRVDVLDFDRDSTSTAADNGRILLAECDSMEPVVDEIDAWVNLPLRIVHSPVAGLCIEIGPYSLSATDVRALNAALVQYRDIALGGAV